MTLVYGGGGIGVMAEAARGALGEGGAVVGVIPGAIRDLEVGYLEGVDLRVVGSMHERKALMADLSDAFVALPGGLGTLDELCEALTWQQLLFHRKPVALLNPMGFWDPFLAALDQCVSTGFVRREHREQLLVEPEPVELLARLSRFEPVVVPKWWEGDAR